MPGKQPQSHDERVARLALGMMQGEAKAVAAQRGLPAELRYATPDEEMALYNAVDEKVDPRAVLTERFAKHTADGVPPEIAMAEAIVETCAVVFPNRLKLAGAAGRLTLTEQVSYLERMAKKSRARREKQAADDGDTMTPEAPETTPPAMEG